MRTRTTIFLAFFGLILASVGLTSLARAEKINVLHQAALASYHAGDYPRAIGQFEQLVELPLHDPTLFFNLGNAYFRANKIGAAIYNYERARQLDPLGEDIEHNLAVARARAASAAKDVLKGTAAVSGWQRFVGALSLSQWFVWFAVAWWLTLAILLLLRFVASGALRSAVVAIESIVAVVCLALAIVLAARYVSDRRQQPGIVLPDEIAVHEGPGKGARQAFSLHAGLPVTVRDREGQWLKVRLANGLEGWLPQGSVGLLN